MKISKQTMDDLLIMMFHLRADISYGAGGSFALNPGTDEEIDTKDIKKVERAMEFIVKLMSEREKND